MPRLQAFAFCLRYSMGEILKRVISVEENFLQGVTAFKNSSVGRTVKKIDPSAEDAFLRCLRYPQFLDLTEIRVQRDRISLSYMPRYVQSINDINGSIMLCT